MNAVTETKPAHTNIATALATAQAEMGKAIKQSTNPAFRSKYADLGSVMDACLPALTKHGICLIQPTGENETGRFVETILLHSSGESLTCRVPLIVGKNDMQGYGSAVTYARRYGLMCMAGIAPEDDDGNAAAQAAPRQMSKDRAAPREAAPDQVQEAIASLKAADSLSSLAEAWRALPKLVQALSDVQDAKDARKAALSQPAITDDEIPY